MNEGLEGKFIAEQETIATISPDRKYVGVSIKHSQNGWRFGMPLLLWGNRITKDKEKRCFGGYTTYLNHAERYAIDELRQHYEGAPDNVFRPDPASLGLNFMKINRKWDTVLVDAEIMRCYCIAAGIPMG